jgi:hypothetical protein
MRTYSLEEAGWNQQLLVHLRMHGCSGMELHWSQMISADDSNGIATARNLFAGQGYVHQWALVGHDPMQPANRVARYQGIWKPLGMKLEGPPAEIIGEWLVEYKEGIRFFGAARHDVLGDARLLAILRQTKGSWLVLGKHPMSVAVLQSWFPRGWTVAGALPPSELLDTMRSKDLIFVRYLEETPTDFLYLVLGPSVPIESQIVSLRGAGGSAR